MILHGFLHFPEFARGWSVGSQAQVAELSQSTSRITATLWSMAAVLFIAASVLYLLRKQWFWIPVAAALVLSQTLIILDWNDAKYGTFVNLLILFLLVLSVSRMQFHTMARNEVNELLANAHTRTRVITDEMISPLPQNVQRWMRTSNVVNRVTPGYIHLVQLGTMRTKPDGKWMPFEAEQYFSIDPPAFVWIARIHAGPFFEIAGRDKYHSGHGNMLIKPLYLFDAANTAGKEIDQGTLLRFMAEMAWFPQAALSPFVKWESISDNEARVTMEYEGVSASGVYTFNENGEVSGFKARRYGEFGGVFRKETWSVSVTGYKTFNDTRIGHTSTVTWKLKEGDFHWLNMEVRAVE